MKTGYLYSLSLLVLAALLYILLNISCETVAHYKASREIAYYKQQEQQHRRMALEAENKGETEKAKQLLAKADYWHDQHLQARIRYYDNLYLSPEDYTGEREMWHERNLGYFESNSFKTDQTNDTAGRSGTNK